MFRSSFIRSSVLSSMLLMGAPIALSLFSTSTASAQDGGRQPSLPIGIVEIYAQHHNNSDANHGHVDLYANGRLIMSLTLDRHGKGTFNNVPTNVHIQVVVHDNGETGDKAFTISNGRPFQSYKLHMHR